MRRTRSRSTHSALTGSPAGSPSTRATSALPCDSPAVENLRCTRPTSHPGVGEANEPGLRRARSRRGARTVRAKRLLIRTAVVGDPGCDQDNEITPVFRIAAEAEQLADDRQAAQERDAGPGLGDLGDRQAADDRRLAVFHQELVVGLLL